jgi:glycosyltransferase involved in cell wall biosynthesis
LEDKRNNDNAGSLASGDSQDKNQKTQGQSNQDSRSRKKFYYNRYRRRRFKPFNKQTDNIQVKTSFKKISIVIPLFNEEESIRPLYIEIKKALKTVACDFEAVFIDDGSTDKSLKNIKEIVRSDPKFKFISFRNNYGKSAALNVGFKNISGDVVITMDSDLQDDPNEIPNLIQKLEEGYDLVSGWKKKRYDPLIKRISSKFFNFVTRIISGIKIHDFNCGLKAYRREVLQNLNVYGELHRYMPVLADWQGFKISEVIVKHHPRRYGKTKYGISRFFKGFIDLLTVMFITRYVKRPMHLFGFLGALAFLIGIVVNGYLTYEWISGQSLSNRPMLFLGILLIIVGVQFFSVGLLGEMMVHNNQNDKVYDIREKS